ncbi:DUF3506 domain-containing protein, partial [bacterium]
SVSSTRMFVCCPSSSMRRTRSSLSSGAADRFSSRKHKPQTLSEISETNFRLRTWSHFSHGILNLGPRIGEAVSTWSTLSPSLYTPTSEKPYQGIFVGDYAAHGCEILLVLQSESPPASARRESVLRKIPSSSFPTAPWFRRASRTLACAGSEDSERPSRSRSRPRPKSSASSSPPYGLTSPRTRTFGTSSSSSTSTTLRTRP